MQVKVGGQSYRLTYIRFKGPQATPLVLCHGLGFAAEVWAEVGLELSYYGDTLALDLPGSGYSAPPATMSPSGVAEIVAAYLETFDRPVHLIGHAFGGLVAALAAQRALSRVARLTLVAPTGVLPAATGEPPPLPRVLVPAMRFLTGQSVLARSMWKPLFHDPGRVAASALKDLAWSAKHSSYLWAGRGEVTRMDLPEILAKLSVPVAYLWGEHDTIFFGDVAQGQLPEGTPFAFVRQTGHLPMIEDGEAFMRAFAELYGPPEQL